MVEVETLIPVSGISALLLGAFGVAWKMLAEANKRGDDRTDAAYSRLVAELERARAEIHEVRVEMEQWRDRYYRILARKDVDE